MSPLQPKIYSMEVPYHPPKKSKFLSMAFKALHNLSKPFILFQVCSVPLRE